MATSTITLHTLSILQDKVSEYNKRSEKLGLNGFALDVGEPRRERVEYNGRSAIIDVVDVTLTGQAPHFDGWHLLAALDRVNDDANILRVVPGHDGEVPAEYRARYVCDHCGTNRVRNVTYVLRHDDGRMVQVGSTCIHDFLPGADAEALIARAMVIYDTINEIDEEGEWYGEYGGSSYVSLHEWLAWASKVIEEEGWVSKRESNPPYTWSTDELTAQIKGSYRNPYVPRHKQPEPPTAANREEADAVVEWVRNELTGDSDYCYNLRTVFSDPDNCFDPKHSGLVTSAVAVYRREMQRRREAEITGDSAWQGTIGKRQIWSGLTVTAIMPREGSYGTTYITKLVDQNGNQYVWFASKKIAEEGETITIKATVKAHDEYRGTRQTILTRCALVESKAA